MFAKPIFAQEVWEITNFESNIQIQQSGEVKVAEKISVNFGTQEKHGIYRDIPVVYTNDDGSKYHTEIKDVSVSGHESKITREGDFLRIRIGDPDVTVSGEQEYNIAYTAVGVLRGFENFDELYWNVTGNYWEVPIRRTSATVMLEGGDIGNVACYVGNLGSTENCDSSVSRSTARFFAQSLDSGQGMTVATSYPKGITEIPLVKSFADKVLSLPAILTFGVSLAAGIGAIFLLWSHKGRDLWMRGKHLFDPHAKEEKRPLFHKDTVVVEYLPPDNLRPAEVGVIMDERANTLDVTGTIIDLATRGYLTITEEEKKWKFGSADYIFNRLNKDTKDLLKYEQELLERLFEKGDLVKMSHLKKSFYTDLKEVKNQLYRDMVEKGFFPSNPENTRAMYLGIAFVGLVFAGVLLIFSINIENEFLFSIAIATVITGFNLLIVSRFMSRRTAKGYEMSRRINGYRLFIENVEKHRQKFFESKNMFNIVLPYAIIFGLTGKFANAMKDMGVEPSTATAGWYYGAHAFNISSFENSMSNFSQSVGAAMASTPSGSGSGSGGGGFSGGGFGGGGGGSW